MIEHDYVTRLLRNVVLNKTFKKYPYEVSLWQHFDPVSLNLLKNLCYNCYIWIYNKLNWEIRAAKNILLPSTGTSCRGMKWTLDHCESNNYSNGLDSNAFLYNQCRLREAICFSRSVMKWKNKWKKWISTWGVLTCWKLSTWEKIKDFPK